MGRFSPGEKEMKASLGISVDGKVFYHHINNFSTSNHQHILLCLSILLLWFHLAIEGTICDAKVSSIYKLLLY